MDGFSPPDWSRQIANYASSFARGDFPALGALFDLTSGRLLRYAQSITRSREDAEDAVQAAIVRIARNPRSLAAVEQPWAYLLRVVRNEALRILTRRRPGGPLKGDAKNELLPASALEQGESTAEIQTALQRLPAEQAEVVILKIWENLTFQEIASVTGESINTVGSRYRYALSKLEGSLRRMASEVGYVAE